MRTREERAAWAGELRARLGALNRPQRELAEYLGRPRATINNWVQGRHTPEEPDIERAEEFFRVMEPGGPCKRKLGARPKYDWETISQYFGELTDAEIARRFGCSKSTIVLQRQARGIPPKERGAKFTPEIVALLGKIRDAEIAEMLGVSRSCVSLHRNNMGIKSLKVRRWTPETVSLLGTAFDKDIAEQLGTTKCAVYLARKRRGIKPFSLSNQPIKLTPEQEQKLGKVLDKDLAQEIGRTGSGITNLRRRRGIPHLREARDQIVRRWAGKLPRSVICNILNVTKNAVSRRAYKLGLSLRCKTKPREWLRRIVGLLADEEIAKIAEQPVELVREVREAAWIPEYCGVLSRFIKGREYNCREFRRGKPVAARRLTCLGRQGVHAVFRTEYGAIETYTAAQARGMVFEAVEAA